MSKKPAKFQRWQPDDGEEHYWCPDCLRNYDVSTAEHFNYGCSNPNCKGDGELLYESNNE